MYITSRCQNKYNIPSIETNASSEIMKGVYFRLDNTKKINSAFAEECSVGIFYLYGGVKYITEKDVYTCDSCYININKNKIYNIKNLKIYTK